jgi:restriction system protein
MPSGGVPQYHKLLWPVIQALRSLGGSGSIAEIESEVSKQQDFSEEQQSVLHGDGPKTEINYRIDWARTYLKGMGLANNTERGIWALTPDGLTITEEEIEPKRATYLEQMRQKRKGRTQKGIASRPDQGPESEEEDAWQDQLLEVLIDLDPIAFERLCQRLLREAGFSRTQLTKASGDGGIDGLGVYRVSLVSFQVYFQAKRWRRPVGAEQVRDFRGAMAGRGEKGLLITTSTFTREAKTEASRDGAPPVDLVDGAMLCELMAQYKIGVVAHPRTVIDYTVDEATLRAI